MTTQESKTHLKFPVAPAAVAAADARRKLLVIQNQSGGTAYVLFDNDGTPAAGACHLELADNQIVQIPNFAGSVKTSDNDVMLLEFT